MASLGFAIRGVMGRIGIWIPYEAIANVNANAIAAAYADAIAVVVEM